MSFAYAGDDLLPDADVVFDRRHVLSAPPESVWPWILQLGKQRAGWYLPAAVERLLPRTRRAVWTIQPRWQTLTVGDRIPDYGGVDGYFEVAAIDAPHALVYRSERGKARFTWALLLTEVTPGQTELHLRFRGAIHSTGLKRAVITTGGDFFDWATCALMLRGLAERVSAPR